MTDVQQVRAMMLRSRERGMDPVEQLNRLGLLLTDEKRNELVREVAKCLADTIESLPSSRLGSPLSAYEMRKRIIHFIRINYTENKP